MRNIPFNIPPATGREPEYLAKAIANHKLCGDGPFTKQCHQWLEERTGAPKALLTTSGTSALEMAQNSERLVWTEEEVDQRLRQIMNNIYTMSVEAAEKYGLGYNLVAGANIAGFQRVADAMMAQGIF